MSLRTLPALHEATFTGRLAEVKELVEGGADLSHTDCYKRTPLMLAIKYSRKDLVEYLLSVMSPNSVSITESRGMNVLHYIALQGRTWMDIWVSICDKCPSLETQLDQDRKLPIDVAREMRYINSEHNELYLELERRNRKVVQNRIKNSMEETYHLNIAVIGHEGVGKTCLVKQLKEEAIPKGGPGSTNLADLFPNHMAFNPKTRSRQKLDEESETETERKRLKRIISREKRLNDEGQNIGKEGSCEENGTRHPQVQHTLKEEEAGVQRRDDESVLSEYEQFMVWKEECTRGNFDTWYGASTEKISAEDKQVIQKFIALYSKHLRKPLYCSKCSKELCKRSWYRCVQCEDTNLCASCYEDAGYVDKGHTVNHDIKQISYICGMCGGYIMDTKIQCRECKSLNLCGGCHGQNKLPTGHAVSHKVDSFSIKIEPSRQMVEQFAKIDEVMKTEEEEDSNPRGFVTFYDFGGEKLFYNTHHCFLSNNMVFIIVFDVSMCMDPGKEKAGFARIKHWLQFIASYARDEEDIKNGTPPILLIGSHMDLIAGTEEEKNAQFWSIIRRLCDDPNLKRIMVNHVADMYFGISNMNDSTKNKDLYQTIWDTIMDAAPRQSQWKKKVPATWLDFDLELARMKASGCNILTFQELKNLNDTLVVPLAGDTEIIEFLKHLQLTASRLVFNLANKNPFVILSFALITRAFNSVLTIPKFKNEKKFSCEEYLQWREFQNTGKLSIQFLIKQWEREQEKDPVKDLVEKTDIICFAMESLGLVSRPLAENVDEKGDYYIVPCMLEDATPDTIQTVLKLPSFVQTSALCIVFKEDFIPQAIWDKLLAACIHRFVSCYIKEYNHYKSIQCGFACLSVAPIWNMILNYKDNKMKIIMFIRKKDLLVRPRIGADVREILEYNLRQILETSHQSHLKYDYFLDSDYRFTEQEKMVKIDDLPQTQNLQCHTSEEPHDINIKGYDFWFETPKQEYQRRDRGGLPNRRPSLTELGRISKLIGNSYQIFLVSLDCPLPLIEQTTLEFRSFSLRSQITKVLIRHLNTNPDIRLPQIASSLDQGETLSELCDTGTDRQFKNEAVNVSPEVLQRPLLSENADDLAKHINPKAYINFFVELGFEDKKLEEFYVDYSHKGVVNMISAMLNWWIKNNRDTATVNNFLLAMEECNMDIASFCEEISLYYTERKNGKGSDTDWSIKNLVRRIWPFLLRIIRWFLWCFGIRNW